MTLDDRPIMAGSKLWFPGAGINYREGEVIEINEAVKAVKLLWFVGKHEKTRGKAKWFAVSALRWTAKKEEAKCQQPTT